MNFKFLFKKGGNRPSNSEHIPMDDVYYVVPGPEDQVDGEDAEPKVYVSTTQGLKKVVERRHSQNSDRLTKIFLLLLVNLSLLLNHDFLQSLRVAQTVTFLFLLNCSLGIQIIQILGTNVFICKWNTKITAWHLSK